MPDADFIFALCNPESERAMKAEVAAMGLDWKPSYQRRGFLSFKLENGIQDDSLMAEIACARRLCRSVGKFDTKEAACAALEAEGAKLIQQARYHLKRMEGLHEDQPAPQVSDAVGTVVQLGETEFWAGLHTHAEGMSADPAGDGGIEMPEDSPSRAWLKLEEAVRFWGLEFTHEDIAVELGCAPGGVVHALLNRGVSVIGVDPAKMADVVTAKEVGDRDELNAKTAFYHCRKPAALVSKRDLGQGTSWFLSDMNQKPEVVLSECARFVKMAPSIRGVLITLKMSVLENIADKADWIHSLHEIGFKTVRLQQLAVHHREFALLGIR